MRRGWGRSPHAVPMHDAGTGRADGATARRPRRLCRVRGRKLLLRWKRERGAGQNGVLLLLEAVGKRRPVMVSRCISTTVAGTSPRGSARTRATDSVSGGRLESPLELSTPAWLFPTVSLYSGSRVVSCAIRSKQKRAAGQIRRPVLVEGPHGRLLVCPRPVDLRRS